MKFPQIVLVVLLSFVVAFATVKGAGVNTSTVENKESVYDRIQRTGEIRCGYSSWAPFFFIDAATGEKKGSSHDTMEEIGKRLVARIN